MEAEFEAIYDNDNTYTPHTNSSNEKPKIQRSTDEIKIKR